MINIFRVNSCEGNSGLTIRIPRPPSERALSSRATMSDGPSPSPFQKRTRPIVKSRSLTTSIDKLAGEQQYRPSSVCSSSRSYSRSSRTQSTGSSVKDRNESAKTPCIHESNNKKDTRKGTSDGSTLSKSSLSSSKEDCQECFRQKNNCSKSQSTARPPEKATARHVTEKSIKGQRKKSPGKNPLDSFPTRNGFPVFNSCMSLFQVQENLRKGELIEGVLLINPKKYEDAYITAPAMIGRGDGHLYWRDI